MVNKYLPVVIRQHFRGGLQKAKTYSKNSWVRLGFMGFLILILSQKKFSFQVSFGEDKTFSANIIDPKLRGNSKEEKKGATVKKVKTKWWNSIKENSKDIREELNLANAATAIGSSLSAKEQKLAANYSNLGFVMNPDYAERKNIPAAVVEAKLNNCRQYIKRFSKTAKEEADLFHIPASITIAQGLLESNAGESRLATQENNHFGIKCRKKCLGCRCANYSDDSKYDMFRIFDSAWGSYREHSKLLNGKRYRHLTKLNLDDYKNWARGLQAAGYATDKKYAKKLIQIIEYFKLYELDQ